ncbi:MAG TPA: hypothetical protein VGH28_11430 [Polyangiaceae bacterium]|jgi:hypothetical protein
MRRAALLAFWLLACADDAPARQPVQARPMDEPRAQQVIAQTFRGEGIEPEGGRTFALSVKDQAPLAVAAAGHKWGVLWLTRDRMRDLAAYLPKHGGSDDAPLVLLNGAGADADVHALALWETDYMTDDLAGEAHSSTEIAAEAKLERDVRDFVVKAKNEGWP